VEKQFNNTWLTRKHEQGRVKEIQIMMHAMPDQIYLTEFKRSAEDRYKANEKNTDQLSSLTLP